jgi:hypothetical protein
MDPIAVTAALLRNQLPDFTIREGASIMARVLSKGEAHAVITIAGIPVTAQLPPEVPAGATLRLKVQEVTPERVTLQIAPDQPAPAPPAATQQASPNQVIGTSSPVADRVQAKVEVEERPARRQGADGEPADVVSLAFTSPTLGRLDLRLELRGERLLTEITTPAGRSHAIANEGAERLRATLEAAGLDVTVKVRARHQPLDLYA